MATQHGSLKEFQPENDHISAYLERAALYFEANEIKDEKKKLAVLLSSIGPQIYSRLGDLFAPEKPSSKTLKEVQEALEKHYEPQRITIAERFHFYKQDQAVGESIAEFDATLRKLAIHCKFGAQLDDALRDRFVCGLRQDSVQRRLLSEKELTYTKAMEISLAMEAADANAKSFKDASINKVSHPPPPPDKKSCYRCGRTSHSPASCRFKDATCNHCGNKGHISPACHSKMKGLPPVRKSGLSENHGRRKSNRHETLRVQLETQSAGSPSVSRDQASSDEEYHLYQLSQSDTSHPPITIPLIVNDKRIEMELDTGASVSIISEQTRNSLFPDVQLRRSTIALKTYMNEQMAVAGQLNVRVKYGSQEAKLVLIVVQGDGPSLLGRNWLKYIKLDWRTIATVQAVGQLDTIIKRHRQLFADELGTVTPYKAKLHVDPQAVPRFYKPRPVPFAIRAAIGKELDLLEKQGIIEKVTNSEWAAPIVPVPKKDGRFHLCGDYKVTVNQALTVEQYPLPKPEELFATLAGGKCFSKLDLSQAYLQVQLDDDSCVYVTVNTHQGLYRYRRLPFGVASAPALFQKLMDTVLRGIPGVTCYIDDILISTKDEKQHWETLEEVFRRLEEHGFRLKQEKCAFLKPSVDYLGHRIDKNGIHPLPSKVTAIVQAPAPTNLQELRSFLGLLNYYSKFISNLSTIIHPLNEQLQSNRKWIWSAECEAAFQLAKEQLASSQVLTHYDPSLPIQLAADASAYGIGAVISHTFPDGTEKPIAFTSRTLTSSERNYAQLEKEALSLVFGVQKFHQYLYGRSFTLITDHKPLTTILGPKKGIPSLAAAHLQRWAIILSAYNYVIQYKSTNEHSNADSLSRLPLPAEDRPADRVSIFNIGQIQALPVTFREIQIATRQDKVISKVLSYVQSGWPQQLPEDLKVYQHRITELGVECGCLMWGARVIVPAKLQAKILTSLHENHLGATRMKAVARSYFWWSGLDRDIERLAKTCSTCQTLQATPQAAPLHPWVWPEAPWRRIHIDCAGPFLGKMFLIIVDAYSKWPEVISMSATTSHHTIEALTTVFSRYGLPCMLVSDNGPQFMSEEFALYLKRNGIKHICSAPYHPSSNGLAERFVRTFKRAMWTGEKSGFSLRHRLSEFLFSYRSTPHTTTGTSPGELFLQRKLRTKFDLLKPDQRSVVTSRQHSQKGAVDKLRVPRDFLIGAEVMVHNYRQGDKWIPGVIEQKLGPLTYQVKTEGGGISKCHIDQLTQRTTPVAVDPSPSSAVEDVSDAYYPVGSSDSPPIDNLPTPEPEPPSERHVPRYPQRDRRPPDRYTCRIDSKV